MSNDRLEVQVKGEDETPACGNAEPAPTPTTPTPPRVLLVAPQAFVAASGTPLNIWNMCKALTELGYEAHVATLPLGRTVEMPGLVYHRVAKIPGLSDVPIGFSVAKLAYDLLLAVKIVRLLRKQRFAVVHGVEDGAFFAAPIARWFRIPMVADLDSDIRDQLLGNRSAYIRSLARLVRPIRRLTLRRSTCALTVAGALTRLVQAESPQTQVFEIRDIAGEEMLREADPAAVERLRTELDLPEHGLVVYTGNFDPRQGVENLVEAMPLVLKKHPSSVLLMVGGERPQLARLRRLTESLGIGDAVRLVPRRPVEEMPEFMALASVLASPRVEPHVTPMKIYAYMASGRPIVATDLPTHTDVLDLNSAILTQPDAPGIAGGIIRALDEPSRSARLGLRARQLVIGRHNYRSFKAKLAEAYRYAEDEAASVGRKIVAAE